MRVFTEEQRFDQWWFRVLMVVTLSIMLITMVYSLPQYSTDLIGFLLGLSICVFAMAVCVWITFFLKLKTRIDELGISYSFWPFHLKTQFLSWQEIKECYVREYSPIAEYGGWGYRAIFFRKNGHAFNVKGNIGIQLILNNSKRILIGTQHRDEVERVIKNYNIKFSS